MFPDKERHWITGPYYSIFFDSWDQWKSDEPYKSATWSSMRLLLWNIKEDGITHKLQILYAKPDGVLDGNTMWGVTINVRPENENSISKWLSEQKYM
jgi:hypothetical protein